MFLVLISRIINDDKSTVDVSLGASKTILGDDRDMLDDLEEEAQAVAEPDVDESGEVELTSGIATQVQFMNSTKNELQEYF